MNVWLWVGFCSCALGIFGLTYSLARWQDGPFTHALLSYERWLDDHAGFVRLRWSGLQILRVQISAATIALVLGPAVPLASTAVALALVALLPAFFLRSRRRRRVAALEQQLDSWLSILSNSLKSTASVADALASTADLLPTPFSDEVQLVAKELRLGVPFDRAVQEAGRRIRSASISAAFMLIVVARRSGADLCRTLADSSAALREAARLDGVLRTKTAEGRGQVLVLALVPFLLCFVIASLDATWFEPMLSHARGHAVIALCAAAWTIAIAWAHRIVSMAL